MKPTLDLWLHWKAACAARRCAADVRDSLWQLGNQWVRLLVSKNEWARQWLRSEDVSRERGWSLYEIHMLTGRADGTPFWKDHMFRRILQDPDIPTDAQRAAALSAYGFNAFKSAVNRYLDKETYKRTEARGIKITSLDEPVGGESGVGGREWFELRPADIDDVQDQVFQREIRCLCEEKLLKPLFEELSLRSRFALAASYSETKLNDPVLLSADLQKVHGCDTDSKLYHARDAAVCVVAAVAKKTFPPSLGTEASQTNKILQLQDHHFLAVTLLKLVSERCVSWAKSEKWSEGLF